MFLFSHPGLLNMKVKFICEGHSLCHLVSSDQRSQMYVMLFRWNIFGSTVKELCGCALTIFDVVVNKESVL